MANQGEPEDPKGSNQELVKAAAATATGAAVGIGASTLIGGMGLTVGGTAISIGAAPVVLAGAVVGMAGYGVYRLFRR